MLTTAPPAPHLERSCHHVGNTVVDGGDQSKMAVAAVDLSQEQQRLRTFATWPPQARISAAKLARAGFYYVGQGFQTKCFKCGVEYSSWGYSDSVMGKHKELSPSCDFVRATLGDGSGGRSESGRRPSEPDLELMRRSDEERLKTFTNWPISFLRPVELARAGFYYLQQDDKVRCAFCRGVIHNWEPGDVPLQEHSRHFPCCPFLVDPSLSHSRDECGRFSSWQAQLSYPEQSGPAPDGDDVTPTPLKRLGIALHSAPKHPAQASPDARLRSFENWPSAVQLSPEELVKAGFFYIGLNDYTKCFHCDGGLCNWEAGDDPWVEHARWFPQCKFVYLSKGEDFIKECCDKQKTLLSSVATSLPQSSTDPNVESELQMLMQSGDVLFYMNQGVPQETLRSSLRAHIERSGKGFSSREELFEVLNRMFSLNARRSEGVQSPPIKQRGSSSKEQDSAAVHVGNAPARRILPSGEAKDAELLELENLRLKEQRLCKICLDAEMGVVFLPCGHLVACPSCATAIKDCPICRKTIVGSVRTYLS